MTGERPLIEGDVLELLEQVGGSVSLPELFFQLHRRHPDVLEWHLADALWDLERAGEIQPTHWQRAKATTR
jgi:hypothetical protein